MARLRAILRLLRRVYLFEWILLVQVAAMLLFLHAKGFGKVFSTLVYSFKTFAIMPVVMSLAGMVVVGVYLAVSNRSWTAGRAYFRNLATWDWWLLTLRLWIGIVLMTHLYTWLKLCVPYLNPGTLDQAIWSLEEHLFFGYSPNVLMLELFRQPSVLGFVDWSYARLFINGLWISLILFPALPSPRIRIAAITGFVSMWTLGGWLHVLLPALGPCYWFPNVWKPFADWLPATLHSQATLLANYQGMTVFRQGADFQVNPLWGVAAFPSMHNANQFLLAFWAWRLNRVCGWLVLISALLIFFGSVITGWHYLIDSVAGVLMAWGAYALSRRLLRPPSTILDPPSSDKA